MSQLLHYPVVAQLRLVQVDSMSRLEESLLTQVDYFLAAAFPATPQRLRCLIAA